LRQDAATPVTSFRLFLRPLEPLFMLRALLIHLSQNKTAGRMVVTNPVSRRMSRRFVAGELLEECIAAARASNAAGMSASLDHLGENVTSEEAARRAQQEYLENFDRIAAEKLDANVSLKLTQLGLDLGDEVCRRLLEPIVERAAQHSNFLRIDMEGSAYTQRTIDLCLEMRRRYAGVGTVIQAYLFRSAQDVKNLLAAGVRIRLCKGAYQEPPEIAFPRKADVDANFVRLMQLLLPSGVYHGIATHDERMIEAAVNFAAKEGIGKEQFEFQMLYGIRTDLQRQLVAGGYRMRIYIPYGTEWFPYFMRRLAERPANVLFVVKNLFRR
jgi:proline dehydrogenase